MSIRFKIIKLGNFHTTPSALSEGVYTITHNKMCSWTPFLLISHSDAWLFSVVSRFLIHHGWFSSELREKGGRVSQLGLVVKLGLRKDKSLWFVFRRIFLLQHHKSIWSIFLSLRAEPDKLDAYIGWSDQMQWNHQTIYELSSHVK